MLSDAKRKVLNSPLENIGGKSGSLPDIQSELRAHLARIKETSSGVRFPETRQLGTASQYAIEVAYKA